MLTNKNKAAQKENLARIEKEKIVDALMKLGVTAIGVSYGVLSKGEAEIRFTVRVEN